MNCPQCQKPVVEPTELPDLCESVFIERGEYNEAEERYEDEADHNVFKCECGAEFVVLQEGRDALIVAREDYFAKVQTRDHGIFVTVSESDYADESACLLQMGRDGRFQCVYLSDGQAEELRQAIARYLLTPKGDNDAA